MPEYIVKSPVQHERKRYEEFSPIELTVKQAAPLLALGAIERPSAAVLASAAEEAEALAQAKADAEAKAKSETGSKNTTGKTSGKK